MGLLTWRAGVGATGYVATATGDNGHVSSCSSNGTSCSVWLECGQDYTAAVLSSTSDCNSSTAATVDFTSGNLGAPGAWRWTRSSRTGRH